MINTNRVKLFGHRQISRTTIHGWPSILLGLPFLMAGIAITLMSLDILIHVPDSKFHVPRKVAAMFGGIFFLPGLYLVVHGFLGLRRISLKNKTSVSPWDIDYSWNPHFIFDSNFKTAVSSFYSSLFIFLFLIPFNYIVFFKLKGTNYFMKGIIGFFDIVFLILLIYVAYNFLKYIKYGSSKLRFNSFPYFLGNKFDAALITSKPIKAKDSIDLTLRFIEEVYETKGSGKNKSSHIATYQLYSENKKTEALPNYQHGSLQIPISFDIPNDEEYKTKLSERPAKYWELEVKAETPGIDYKSSFLIPIY